jgi:hypothetical protein
MTTMIPEKAKAAAVKRTGDAQLAETFRHGRLSRGGVALARDMSSRRRKTMRLRHVVKSRPRD